MKELLKHPAVTYIVMFIIFISGLCVYLDRSTERERKATETAVLTGNGYTNIIMMDERGTCPRGVYARWYEATNPSGVREHGLVCITYDNDTPYVISTYKREGK